MSVARDQSHKRCGPHRCPQSTSARRVDAPLGLSVPSVVRRSSVPASEGTCGGSAYSRTTWHPIQIRCGMPSMIRQVPTAKTLTLGYVRKQSQPRPALLKKGVGTGLAAFEFYCTTLSAYRYESPWFDGAILGHQTNRKMSAISWRYRLCHSRPAGYILTRTGW